MKTINDIRQCDIFDHSVLNFLQNLNPVNLDVSYRENSFCTVITQDCDIVHQKQEEEPFVEFIIGDLTQDKSVKMEKILENFILKMVKNYLSLIFTTDFLSRKSSLPDLIFLMFCTD